MKRILMLCSSSQNIYNFRMPLIKKFEEEGYEVYTTAFDNEYSDVLKENGVRFSVIRDCNRSINLIKILSLKSKYYKLMKQIKPDIVFTFMLKPNTFGVLAAHKAGINNIYSMVEGAGDVFIKNGLKWKLIKRIVCLLYKKSFIYSKKVFFINNNDRDEFVERKIVKDSQCEVIHGVGVDFTRFRYKPISQNATFIMLARLLRTKGVFEYCEAARIVKRKYPIATFYLAGREEELKVKDIKEYIDDLSVNYLGELKDVIPFIEKSTVNVLPSYREGFGLVNAEAAAIGRPSITCDTNGTRDTIIDRVGGFLIRVANVDDLVEKMVYYIENPEQADIMGKNARKFAEENFDTTIIHRKIVDIILKTM